MDQLRSQKLSKLVTSRDYFPQLPKLIQEEDANVIHNYSTWISLNLNGDWDAKTGRGIFWDNTKNQFKWDNLKFTKI